MTEKLAFLNFNLKTKTPKKKMTRDNILIATSDSSRNLQQELQQPQTAQRTADTTPHIDTEALSESLSDDELSMLDEFAKSPSEDEFSDGEDFKMLEIEGSPESQDRGSPPILRVETEGFTFSSPYLNHLTAQSDLFEVNE